MASVHKSTEKLKEQENKVGKGLYTLKQMKEKEKWSSSETEHERPFQRSFLLPAQNCKPVLASSSPSGRVASGDTSRWSKPTAASTVL